ncbi:ATP-binding protein [Arthrobacter jiangjiafuii]|uniref:ATP-binding protein n=1 Tax=Arthrobacter jiangjiafuii TaxID=2817475 RepID=A0A975M740_9MICC|nr:ATP-binding protein [Arthrobacter jiangjiafuii]MBP3045027.1 26S protease regulatory subunit [Arthrobacter jiangjiafuii]QWC10646.1 ATP-binding protein [Arthrobacter jiangjiafuii]
MDEKLGEFLANFNRAIELARTHTAENDGREHLVDVLTAHVGVAAADVPIVSQDIPVHRFADLDIAMETIAARDPGARLIGVGGGQQRQHQSLSDLVQEGFGPVGIGQPDFLNLAIGPERSRDVVALGLRLFTYEGIPLAVLQRAANPQYGRSGPDVAVLAREREAAVRFLAEIQEDLRTNSILRGQVVSFAFDPYGQQGAGVTFLARPSLPAGEVILPDGVLDRVGRHVLGIAANRDVLLSHGQHLKRGVLLYGPPGTGKTHTVRHLLSASEGTTAVLLAGNSLHAVGEAARLARAMAPSMVILEDIDLVAEDRNMGHGPQPLLFEVLDALDGLDADADVVFLMTTNRAEALERALVQRPGRVDLAVEIPLPDAGNRLRLLELYAPAGVFSAAALGSAAEQSVGATASFARELVRRAVLRAVDAGQAPADEHLAAAVQELMGQGEALTRSLLGTGGGGDSDDPGLPHGQEPHPGVSTGYSFGWVGQGGASYVPLPRA